MKGEVLLALVLLTAGLAGCIQGGEELSPASTEPVDPSGAGDDAGDGAGAPPSDDGTDDATSDPGSGNATPTNATSSTEDKTDPSADPPTDPLPSNVTLANASLVERTEDSATFRWNGSTPGEPQTESGLEERELTVPPDRWLAVNATLTWEGDRRLPLALSVMEDEVGRCFATPQFRDFGSADTVKICESRPQPLDGWSTWDVRVASPPVGESVNFTLELTIENVGPDGPWGDLDRAPGRPGAWTPAEEASIRPGVVSWTNSQCTLNVLFTSSDGSSVYAGSAAHCLRGKAIGAMVHIGGIPNAGRLVYCAWGTEVHGHGHVACPDWRNEVNETSRNDFGLVEIKPSLVDEVNPSLPYWGGPTGMAEPVEAGERLMIYGNSSFRDADRDGVPDLLDPIRAIAVDQTERTVVMEAPGVFLGDSGGPALDSKGRALGVSSALAHYPDTKQAPVEVWYANLPWAVGFMEDHTSLEVELLTAPLEERPWTMAPGGR